MITNNEIIFICILLVLAVGFYIVSIIKKAGVPMVLSGIALILLGSLITDVPQLVSYDSVDFNNNETVTHYTTETWSSVFRLPLTIFFWLIGVYQLYIGGILLLSGKSGTEIDTADFEDESD